MAGDVDELPVARHEGARVAAGALLEGVVIGAVDEHHVQAHARHDDPADRLALPYLAPEPPGDDGQPVLLRGDRLSRARALVGVDGEFLVQARGETVLLVVGVERRERILPAPGGDRPRERA
jgi:hypothetical protein